MRSFNREAHQARPVTIQPGFTENADGSVLICFGGTKVICTAFLEEKVPPFLRNQKKGWVTAEYGMLPGSTHSRTNREAARGKQSGRTVEISRLIGRALRTCIDDERLGEHTVQIDCDVIQADGGTRTASITGGFVALALCLHKHRERFEQWPMVASIAAVSLGIAEKRVLVDLDYSEDSACDVDLNLVLNHDNCLVEIQGTAEQEPFTFDQLQEILKLGADAIAELRRCQYEVLAEAGVEDECLP